jgi:ATP-binding protein involved in chromosome partitioning
MAVSKQDVLAAIAQITDPVSGRNLAETGYVRALAVEGGDVRFVLEVPPEHGAKMEPLRATAERRVAALPGVSKVSVLLTAHSAKAPPDLTIGRHPTPQAGPQTVPGIARIIVVASGKGGVGKSTVASNLAVALAAEGRRVGLLDADFYGPSQPRMMGVSGRPASPDGKNMIPPVAHGVTMMSLGLLTRADEAVVWRGPMLMGAMQQMLGQVLWGELDILLIDLPPGTGDVQLTLGQKTVLTGAIIVSTPQDVALLDARKAMDMFVKLKTPILGMIENMSTYVCPNCGHEAHIFGHGGAAAEAARQGMPLLGEIPLDLSVRLAGDAGVPIAASEPDGPQARAFRRIAARLVAEGKA